MGKKSAPRKKTSDDGLLQRAAKVIGSALGAVASKAGIPAPSSALPKAIIKGKKGPAKKSASRLKTTERETDLASRKQKSSGKLRKD